MSEEFNGSADRETDPSWLSFTPGQRLKKARELRGLSVPQVARELHLSERFIVAMEADDYAALPEPAFVRGYMRRYAQLVKLSGDEIIARFDENHSALRDRNAVLTQARNPVQLLGDMSRERLRWRQMATWVAVVMLLLVTVGTLVWRKGSTKPAPMLPVDSAPVAVSAPLVPIAAPTSLPGSLPTAAPVAGNELPPAPSTLPALGATGDAAVTPSH